MTTSLPPPFGVTPRAARPWGFFAAGFGAGATSAVVAAVLFAAQCTAPQLSARLEAPESVSIGQEFELRIRVHNPHAEAVELDSVDAPMVLLDSFDLEPIEPLPQDGSPVDGLGTRTWWFEQRVEPGDELRIAFRAKALRAGTQQLGLDVCNELQDCDAVLASIQVTEAP